MNYLDWISKWASYTPDKKAMFCYDTGQSFTYRQLNEYSLKIGAYLKNEYQLKKGDRLAVLAEHFPEYLMLFIATQRLGIILVPLNYRAAEFELEHCLKDVTPALFLADLVSFEAKAIKLQEKLGIAVIPASSFFGEAFKQKPALTSEKFEIAVDHPIFIFYTSGTTGKPKGVLYTNRMLFWNSLNTSVQLEITSKDHTINALPPYHTSGWNVLLLPMLHRGARVDFMKKFRPKKLLQYIEEEPVSLFLAVPTMLRMMAKTDAFQNFNPKKLKYIVAGGESLSILLIETWAQKGILISQGYGLTEAGPSITSLHYHDALWKKGSIGKPNFYVDVKIVDKNNDEVAANQPGELCLRGNIVTPGYWNDFDHSFSKMRDNWFHTGDIVKVDNDGFLYIVGRKSQMFISGGENIHPSEIEQVLYKCTLVREAAVVGVEDENWGEIGIAFIVLKDEKFQSSFIMEHLKVHLASYKIPKDIIFLKNLPKVGIGKIDRKELRDMYKNMKYDKRNSM